MAERSYRTGGRLSQKSLEQEIDSVWSEIQTDEDLRRAATEAGIDLKKLQQVDRRDAIRVEKRTAGFGAETIVIAFLPVAVKITMDLWDKIILPRIIARYGRDAIAEQKKEQVKQS